MQLFSDKNGRLGFVSTMIALVAVFVMGFALGNQQSVSSAQRTYTQPTDEVTQNAFGAFWQSYELIRNSYIEAVDPAALAEAALRGMIDSLGDQYSGYMSPSVFEMHNTDLQGEYEGIGVVITTNETTGLIEVVGLLEGSPAAAVGVRRGDIFTNVDGRDVTNISQSELAAIVRGPQGTEVRITMQRGDELIDFTILRARITSPNIVTRILDEDVGYIRLNQFSETARRDFDAALNEIAVNERAGLIVDFRGNPGGTLSSAIEIGSAFVESGPIVIEEFGDGRIVRLEANGTYAGIAVPVAVIVNGSSASASELVAGALQDLGLATIVGETTLGKGTVQTWQSLVNGGGIRLTIARWLTPNGRWIHEAGVTPDIVIEWEDGYGYGGEPGLDDPQISAAIDLLTGQFEGEMSAEPAGQ